MEVRNLAKHLQYTILLRGPGKVKDMIRYSQTVNLASIRPILISILIFILMYILLKLYYL